MSRYQEIVRVFQFRFIYVLSVGVGKYGSPDHLEYNLSCEPCTKATAPGKCQVGQRLQDSYCHLTSLRQQVVRGGPCNFQHYRRKARQFSRVVLGWLRPDRHEERHRPTCLLSAVNNFPEYEQNSVKVKIAPIHDSDVTILTYLIYMTTVPRH